MRKEAVLVFGTVAIILLAVLYFQNVQLSPQTNERSIYIAPLINTDSPIDSPSDTTPVNAIPVSPCIPVRTPQDLDNVRNNLAGNYCQMNDIDLAGYSNWIPIGDDELVFLGSYNGNNKEIRNLKISEPLSSKRLGLFGALGNPFDSENPAYVKSIALRNVSIEGGFELGALAGNAYNAIIYDSHVIGGVIKSRGIAGGLVGQGGNFIINASSVESLTIISSSQEETHTLGGLIGASSINAGPEYPFYYNVITHSYTKEISIKGASQLGGLAGSFRGDIEKSYSFAEIITSLRDSGGLVGILDGSLNGHPTNILDSYSLGTIYDLWNSPYPHNVPGGLIGTINLVVGESPIVVKNSYSGVLLSSSSLSGGLIGKIIDEGGANVNIDSSYWDTQMSGQTQSAGGTGLTTNQMKQQPSFVNWDFANEWKMINGKTYPWLSWQTVDQNQLLYYKFNEKNQNGITPDDSLYARHATTNGITILNSIRGPIFSFNAGDYVRPYSGGDLDLGNKFTLAGWIKLDKYPSEIGQPAMKIMDKGLSGQDYSSYGLLINASNSIVARVYTANNGASVFDAGSLPLQKGTWYFVTATLDSLKLKLYVNGVLVSTRVVSGAPYNNNDIFLVGAQQTNAGGFTNHFYGAMDDMRIYSRALSLQEIQNLYHS